MEEKCTARLPVSCFRSWTSVRSGRLQAAVASRGCSFLCVRLNPSFPMNPFEEAGNRPGRHVPFVISHRREQNAGLFLRKRKEAVRGRTSRYVARRARPSPRYYFVCKILSSVVFYEKDRCMDRCMEEEDLISSRTLNWRPTARFGMNTISLGKDATIGYGQ